MKLCGNINEKIATIVSAIGFIHQCTSEPERVFICNFQTIHSKIIFPKFINLYLIKILSWQINKNILRFSEKNLYKRKLAISSLM